MAKQRKVIITCAVTGAIHTPSMSPYLPVTADEIADAAVGAAEAGAAIIHLHARNQQDGRPDQTAAAFGAFLPKIKERCDAVLNLTTGGSPYMTLDQRLEPRLDQRADAAAQDGLLAKQVGLGLLGERRLDDTGPRDPERLGIGHREVAGATGRILLDRDQRRRGRVGHRADGPGGEGRDRDHPG